MQVLEEQVRKLTEAAAAGPSPGEAAHFEAYPEPWKEPETLLSGGDSAEQREATALLAAYLRYIIEGWSDADSMSPLLTAERGWFETLATLQGAARDYLTLIPANYPSRARQAMLRLRNAELASAFNGQDPVMALVGLAPQEEAYEDEEILDSERTMRQRMAAMKPASPPSAWLPERSWVNPETGSSHGTPSASVMRPRSSAVASSSPGMVPGAPPPAPPPAGPPPGHVLLPAPAMVYNAASKSFDAAPLGIGSLFRSKGPQSLPPFPLVVEESRGVRTLGQQWPLKQGLITLEPIQMRRLLPPTRPVRRCRP
jgi:hypothetical protein